MTFWMKCHVQTAYHMRIDERWQPLLYEKVSATPLVLSFIISRCSFLQCMSVEFLYHLFIVCIHSSNAIITIAICVRGPAIRNIALTNCIWLTTPSLYGHTMWEGICVPSDTSSHARHSICISAFIALSSSLSILEPRTWYRIPILRKDRYLTDWVEISAPARFIIWIQILFRECH